MNEDIIRMAREAGAIPIRHEPEAIPIRHEPKDVALVGIKNIERLVEIAKAEEREACAAICDRFQARDVGMQPAECAGAIRARGNT